MTAPAPPRPITAEEFLHMPQSRGAELVDGVIKETRMSGLSSWIGGELGRLIGNFVQQTGLGWAFPPDTGFAIWPARAGHVRKPDVAVVARNKLPGGPPANGWVTVVPDLVVEVVSPGDEAAELEQKLVEYRGAGIALIWVIYPTTRTAHVLGAARPLTELGPDGVLNGQDVLPGFSCSLAELFTAAQPEQ